MDAGTITTRSWAGSPAKCGVLITVPTAPRGRQEIIDLVSDSGYVKVYLSGDRNDLIALLSEVMEVVAAVDDQPVDVSIAEHLRIDPNPSEEYLDDCYDAMYPSMS